MNDILRDVYAQPPETTATPLQANTVTRKRARSVSEQDDAPEGGMRTEDNPDAVLPLDTPPTDPSRPIRPLRTSSRSFLQTRSLPASAFAFSTPSQTALPPSISAPLEEEDWSENVGAFKSQSALEFEPVEFEPMTFE